MQALHETGESQARIELGQFIIADPKICHGQPTYKGTRVMAWLVLEQVERGMPWDQISKEWGGQVSTPAIAETIALSHLIQKDKAFRGFHAHSRRKYSRQPAAMALALTQSLRPGSSGRQCKRNRRIYSRLSQSLSV